VVKKLASLDHLFVLYTMELQIALRDGST